MLIIFYLPVENSPSNVDKRHVFHQENVQLKMDFYQDSHSLHIAYPPTEPALCFIY